MTLKLIKTHLTFGGKTQFWEHDSVQTKTKMKFSTFIPEGPVKGCVIWLSGLTCTEENFITKAGAQKYLAKAKLMAICPDTSPRGTQLPLEHESYDFGSGAGFYLNATTPGYQDHYRMDSYVTEELGHLLQEHFQISPQKISLMGHSMGGHGALVLGLREAEKFQSVSAFSPIVNPSQAPWGVKAFQGYLGSDQKSWEYYDATCLVRAGKKLKKKILIDQGMEDEFLTKQLLTENFIVACKEQGQELSVQFRPGYDHSYYFISTFIESHVKFHADILGA